MTKNKFQERWNEERKKVLLIKDGLGKTVDNGIVDTIVALHMLSIHTSASWKDMLTGPLADHI